MTSPERLSEDQLNRLAISNGHGAAAARECIASRRLAPVHEAAVALADLEMRYTFHDGQPVSESEWMAGRDAYRAARRALEPQPEREDEAERGEKARNHLHAALCDGSVVNVFGIMDALDAYTDERIRAALRERGA